MIIEKFVIESQRSEEMEFEIQKVTKTEIIVIEKMQTDDAGNILSANIIPDKTTTKTMKQGISAVSLPSRTPAVVRVLKTTQGEGEGTFVENEESINEAIRIDQMMRNEVGAGGRPATIDLSAIYNNDRAKPMVIPKAGEISWADEK